MANHKDRDSERGQAVVVRERGRGKTWQRRAAWTSLIVAIAIAASMPGLVLALDATGRVDRLQRDVTRLQSDVSDLRGIVGYLLSVESSREKKS